MGNAFALKKRYAVLADEGDTKIEDDNDDDNDGNNDDDHEEARFSSCVGGGGDGELAMDGGALSYLDDGRVVLKYVWGN